MSKSLAYKHQIRALSKWPKDALRPETQFQDAIRRRIDRRLGIAPKTDTKKSGVPAKPTRAWDEAEELKQANALYSLVADRYSRKFPIVNNLMKPAGNPTYYIDLVAELEAAPSRSWWDRVANRWKGMLRFQ